jgi:hypothetical protein
MRISLARFGIVRLVICASALCTGMSTGRSQNPPTSHVTIPNPTPRQPDLEKEFETPNDQKNKASLSIQNQLRAREIWLESNEILLLAQQLQQEINSGKKSVSMNVNAGKAGQIEKLAQSVQRKMKVR